MSLRKKALEFHEKLKGKLEIKPRVSLDSREELVLAYTPGVAEPCKEIAKNESKLYDYTVKGNCVAVVSDGSAVLGLGNIGGAASLPVMEGKAIIFKCYGNVDAFPIGLKTQEAKEIVEVVKSISPVFGGINLEDIAAPKCFEVEQALQDIGIPVFHDDQHGTAIVVLAALLNAAKVVGKNFNELKVVISGAGAAGNAVAKLLTCHNVSKKLCQPVKELIVCDSKGIIFRYRKDLDKFKKELAEITNPRNLRGALGDAMKDMDVFIGLSVKGIVSKEMIASMSDKPIVLAMANPDPEIMPEEAKEAGAFVVGTGRSDYPNQINNMLAFPGVFRGALDAKASRINFEMQVAAAKALASCVENPVPEKIFPDSLDKTIALRVAEAVKKAAIESGVARIKE